MRKEDMSVAAALLEAATMILGVCYLVLQVYYGMRFHLAPSKFIMNILAEILVYAALMMLQFYPERVNRLTSEMFTLDIRKLTIRMLRLIKFVFVAGLLVPSVFDCMGVSIYSAASLVVIVLIAVIAVYYEMRIYRILKDRKDS